MPRCLITLVWILAACGGREVRVKVAIPGADSADAPVANLPLVVLSYDRDSIIALLESTAPSPAPITQRLDPLFRAFQVPFHAYVATSLAVTRAQDSLAAIKSRLDSLPRSAPDYAWLYGRFSASRAHPAPRPRPGGTPPRARHAGGSHRQPARPHEPLAR